MMAESLQVYEESLSNRRGLLGALVAIPLAAALRVVVIEMVAPLVRRQWIHNNRVVEG